MSAYVIFENLEVTDPVQLDEYKHLVPATVARHGGRYVVRGGALAVLEGFWAPIFPVMIEFPSVEAARRWYDSPEYRPLRAMRVAALRSNTVLVEGV